MEGSSRSMAHDVAGFHDTLRLGLPGVKNELAVAHPLQSLDSMTGKQAEMKRMLLGNTYGSAFHLRMDLDKQILSRFQRPSGVLPSSMVGLEALTGSLEDFGFEDYLNDPLESETFRPVDMHHGMEVRLGLSKGPAYSSFI
ncbi:cyclin-B1-2-like isoform X2 [Nymphaea colorata]|nr:cyclin-B1-2-like isoform X2 [Nymphaea colorata]